MPHSPCVQSFANDSTGTNSPNLRVLLVPHGQEPPAGFEFAVPLRPPCNEVAVVPPMQVHEHSTTHPCPVGDGNAFVARPSRTPGTEIFSKGLKPRTQNRRAHADFTRNYKKSISFGKKRIIKVPKDSGPPIQHCKSRWHAAVKEVAYSVLDLRVKDWTLYSKFEKDRLHSELAQQFKFDPPLNENQVEKYIAGHLRGQRCVWKAHWVAHGSDNRHTNCPPEAWATLTKWWSTQAAADEAEEMCVRRAKVITPNPL